MKLLVQERLCSTVLTKMGKGFLQQFVVNGLLVSYSPNHDLRNCNVRNNLNNHSVNVLPLRFNNYVP